MASMENTISRIIAELHETYRHDTSGAVADYIPELTQTNPEWFGISIVTTDGHQYEVGDTREKFTIQSISKAFTYGMILDEHGAEKVAARIGVEPSGEAFNSIRLDPETGRPPNPMVNAGAIAASGMVTGTGLEDRFEKLRSQFSRYADEELTLDDSVYQSESSTGFRNRAIANLLRNFEKLDDPVDESVELYFKQCSIEVTCADLAVMAGSLANGGVNPKTGERVLKAENVEKVLSVMSTCGIYDHSGEWMFHVGLPAKSGVGGGIIGVLPGKLSVAVFSPLLDPKGNSVRGVKTFREISRRFNLHFFNSPVMSDYCIRRVYRLSEIGSNRQRMSTHHEAIRQHGDAVLVAEMQGDLFFSAVERLVRAQSGLSGETHTLVVDLSRAGLIDGATQQLICRVAREISAEGRSVVFVDPKGLLNHSGFKVEDHSVSFSDGIELALEHCEDQIIREHLDVSSEPVAFQDFDLLESMSRQNSPKSRRCSRRKHFRKE